MQTQSKNNVVYLASYIRIDHLASARRASPAQEGKLEGTPRPRHVHRARIAATPVVTDDDLIEQVALGDLLAAATLRERHEDRLCRAATAILKDDDEARRVVETALEEACCAWPPERGEVGPWLRRLVLRAARARRRVLHGERTPLDFAR